ncbi:hypothetical protein HHI36_017740 [Cryptolaemus montrouzieri]|uniref:SCP domain-containing protein n=1 Tax=Cryptolaemus montrouzieri TaxID=559131 RepID=A0ABD2NNQ7_9CUCU
MGLILLVTFTLFTMFYCCFSRCNDGINGFGMKEKDRIDVVFWHKHYRDLIQEGEVPNHPQANDMPELSYNFELETEAQYFANRCHFEHSPIKTQTWGEVGVNLHMQVSKIYDNRQEWAQIIFEWWNEHDMNYYGKDIILEARHYTQIVWDESKYLGCGFTVFPINHPNLTLYHKFYVCTYAPKGNVKNKLPYKPVNGKFDEEDEDYD